MLYMAFENSYTSPTSMYPSKQKLYSYTFMIYLYTIDDISRK